MKYYIFFIFTVFAFSSAISQNIEFGAESFADATKKAKESNKLIFVDAYTTWCGPCKWLAKNVFTDKDVADYYNENFINFKIDMEKGEGPDLARKWEIKGYPTLLFLDQNGEVIHRSIGARPAVEFLDLGNAANDPDRQVVTLQNKFESGERSEEFLKKYTEALTSSGMKGFDEVAQLYMDTQKDWATEENMKFIFDYAEASMESKLFQYTVENKEAFIALVGEEDFYQKLSYASDMDRSKAGISRTDKKALENHYKKYFDDAGAKKQANLTYFSELMYSKDPVEQEKFKAEIQLFLASKPDLGSQFYNSVAWQLYEITDDAYLLKKAAEWADISIEGEKNSYNTDTQAAIQFKLGNYEKARRYALESIELAKENGDDYTATSQLLEKIMEKR